MVVDTMTKQEVLAAISREFKADVLPKFRARLGEYKAKIKTLAARNDTTVYLPWVDIRSSDQTIYRMRVYGDNEEYNVRYVAEFFWQRMKCYAFILNNAEVMVYQAHALDRYAERVLNKCVCISDVFYKYIVKNIDCSLRMVLPTQTHELSVYSVIANGLFLGDYDRKEEDNDSNGFWLNTCVSLTQAGETQSRILDVFRSIQEFCLKLGYNPTSDIQQYIHNRRNVSKKYKSELIDFFKKTYLLYKLQLLLDVLHLEKTKKDQDETLKFISDELQRYGVNIDNISPYDKVEGVAKEGEIEYRGSNE